MGGIVSQLPALPQTGRKQASSPLKRITPGLASYGFEIRCYIAVQDKGKEGRGLLGRIDPPMEPPKHVSVGDEASTCFIYQQKEICKLESSRFNITGDWIEKSVVRGRRHSPVGTRPLSVRRYACDRAAKIVSVAVSLACVRNSGSDNCIDMSHLP